MSADEGEESSYSWSRTPRVDRGQPEVSSQPLYNPSEGTADPPPQDDAGGAGPPPGWDPQQAVQLAWEQPVCQFPCQIMLPCVCGC